MSDQGFDVLERELVELGRSVETAPPRDDLVASVLARIVALEPASDQSEAAGPVSPSPGTGQAPSRGALRSWLHGKRLGWALAAATVLLLALIPPVRAAVLELLRIGGVVVREEPPPRGAPDVTASSPSTSPEPGATLVTLEQAERLVGVDIHVPSSLGPPTSVAVGRDGKVVELTWVRGGSVTRLELFDGSLSWGYLKTVWSAITPTQVKGHEAVWLGAPHLIEWLDRSGRTHREEPRLAGPTLVWVEQGSTGEVTYRLEGPRTLAQASAIAQS